MLLFCKKQTVRLLFLLITSFFCSVNIYAQSVRNNEPGDDQKYKIGITTGSFLPEKGSPDQAKVNPQEIFQNKYFRLIQFYELPSDEQRKVWASNGLSLTDYLPGNLYFAVIESDFPMDNIANSIRAIFPVDRRFKMEAELYYNGISKEAVNAKGEVEMILSYYSVLNADQVIRDLTAQGVRVKVHTEYAFQLEVSFNANRLEQITALPYIQFIGSKPKDPINEAENLAYRNTTDRSNYLNTGYNGMNYNGTGVVISIGEGGTIDNNSIDFKGRLNELTTGSPSDHKIGCMGNAASSGNFNPEERSHAWGATLLSTNAENYPSLISNQNVRYFNHSYGWGIAGGYDASARNHDLRVATQPNHIVSYSSGNTGDDPGYAPYNFNSWGNITGMPKHNKNHLVVANLSPKDDILSWGCKGPAFDGRILPHITVAGPEGTSYASPKAVGLLAQLEQAYKATYNAESPGSLMRAILFNTADDMDNPGPDFRTGYGRPNGRRALQVILNNQFMSGTLSNGNSNSHTIVVPAGTKQVRVMLVWPDVAAAVNANPTIVNNLNLTATSPLSVLYNPWVLDHTANAVNLNTPATRKVDNLNTIEQITVDNPEQGNWTIQVNGANVPTGPQQYYISYEFVNNELFMAYPLENEKMISGDTYILKWDSYGETGTFTLDYQIDGGGWINIVAGYNSANRFYEWIAPNMTGVHTVKFRVKRGALTSESGINYFGQVPANFRISKVCNDVVNLKWSPVTDATAYKVYRLGTKYMEEVTSNVTITGNSAVLTGQSTTAKEYYAVAAISSTFEGQRSLSIEKAAGDFNCVEMNWTGVVSTDWFNTANWSTNALPTCNDNISIPSTATNQPVINASGAACGNITIQSGATLAMSNTSAYTLSVCGDWINNGTFTRGIGTVSFSGTNNYQELTGSSTTAFNVLNVNKGNVSRILEVTALISLNASVDPLLITSGTFKLSSNSTLTPFTTSAAAELGSSKGIWNNGGTINYGNFSWYNAGQFRISSGTTNIGTAANNTMIIFNNGSVYIEGGVLNVAGGLMPNSAVSTGSYFQSGGTVNVNLFGLTNTSRGAFEMPTGFSFTMVGGKISIRRACSNSADIILLSNSSVVTGGTIQIGDGATPTAQNIRINSTVQIYNLEVNAFNAPTTRLITNGLTVKNNVSVLGGTLDANSLNLIVKGNWLNNGTFTPGSGTVTFDGVLPQILGGSAASTFNNLTINNAEGITLSANATVNNTLTLTSGVVSTSSNTVIMGSAGTVTRTSGHIFGNLRKNIATGTSVARTFEIGDATAARYTPVSMIFASVSTAGNITAKVTASDHPNISSSILQSNKSVNRFWSLTNNGVVFTNYDATFSFLNSDLDAAANTNNLVCGTFNTPNWTYPTIGTKTATSTQITGASNLGDFQLSEGCANPDVPTISASSNNICSGSNTTLSISAGNLNAATNWQWYTGSCGGTLAGSGTSIQVSPTQNMTYFVRGEGGCVTPGTCASVNVAVTNPTTPAFDQVAPYCVGAAIPALPSTSTNGISGTWSPALNNNATTIYTFTPIAGQCASTTTMTITVNAALTPTFNTFGPYCQNETPASLPSSSTNGFTGTWNPSTISTSSTGTQTYLFTPSTGQCANTNTLFVDVNAPSEPNFTVLGPYCKDETPGLLPTTSANSITGTWSPSSISTAVAGPATYTFTPASGTCATTASMVVTINAPQTPTFATFGPYCQGSTPANLPSSSFNGFAGTWNPIAISTTNQGAVTYTFAPNSGQCATTASLTVNVTSAPTATAPNDQFYCAGNATSPITLSGSPSGVLFDISGGSAVGLANATGVTAIPSFTPTSGTATITITPKLSECVGTAATFNINASTSQSYYTDFDADGFGAQSATAQFSCSPVSGKVTNKTDCNDNNSAIKPGAVELCNGVDDNCDGISELICTAPPITGVTVSGNSANFSWPTGCYLNYRLQYRRSTISNAAWTLRLINASTTSTTVTGLSAGSYTWGLRGICMSSNNWSGVTSGNNFVIGAAMMAQTPGSSTTAMAYPNPANDRLYVRLTATADQACFVRFTDQLGRTLYGQHHEVDGVNNISIPTQALPSGIYFLHVIIDGHLQTERVIVNH